MIINTGNRTDIPAYYGEWFVNRIKEGYVYVRNPYVDHRIMSYSLSQDVVDIICFGTKNPIPFLKYIPLLKDYRLYFQVTITPYNKDIEPYVPNKNRIIDAFIKLSRLLNKHSVTWRYDPIFINDYYTKEYHINIFKQMCQKLSGYTNICIVSFIDLYEKTKKNFPDVQEVSQDDQIDIIKAFVEIGKDYGISIYTCLENSYLSQYGVNTSGCMTQDVLHNACDIDLDIPKLSPSRKGCTCLLSNDIGEYNTCLHGCRYCYANYDMDIVKKNYKKHDPLSPLLIGHVSSQDKIVEVKQESYINKQLSFDF